MELNVRSLEDTDLSQVGQLFFDTVHTVNSKDYAPEQLEAWAPRSVPLDRWERSFESKSAYVAEIEGVIVGFADMTAMGEVDHLYVHWRYQGCGVGQALLAKLEEEARTRGLAQLTVESSITAKSFFQRHGFVSNRTHEKWHGGIAFTTFLMSKCLN